VSGNTAAALAVALVVGLALAARFRPAWFGDKPPAPPALFELRLDGRGIGDVVVAGHALESYTRGVDIRTGAGELSQVNLELVLVDGIELALANAGINATIIADGRTFADIERHEALHRYWSYPSTFGFSYDGPMSEARMREVLDIDPDVDLEARRPRWRTAGDASVCDVCAELEGAELLEGERAPHENCENPDGCRCTAEIGPNEAATRRVPRDVEAAGVIACTDTVELDEAQLEQLRDIGKHAEALAAGTAFVVTDEDGKNPRVEHIGETRSLNDELEP
jgi:hypothetical protein